MKTIDQRDVAFFGVDPGFGNSALVLRYGGKILAYATIEEKRATKKLPRRFIAEIFNMVSGEREYRQDIVPIPGNPLGALDAYAKMFLGVYDSLQLLLGHHTGVLCPIYGIKTPGIKAIIGIEEPFGTRVGPAALIDKVYIQTYNVFRRDRSLSWKGTDAGKVYPLNPTNIKKEYTGKGNASKEIMIKEVFKKDGFDIDNNHLADACAMSWVVEQEYENDKDYLCEG